MADLVNAKISYYGNKDSIKQLAHVISRIQKEEEGNIPIKDILDTLELDSNRDTRYGIYNVRRPDEYTLEFEADLAYTDHSDIWDDIADYLELNYAAITCNMTENDYCVLNDPEGKFYDYEYVINVISPENPYGLEEGEYFFQTEQDLIHKMKEMTGELRTLHEWEKEFQESEEYYARLESISWEYSPRGVVPYDEIRADEEPEL